LGDYIDRHALKNDGHLCWHDGKGKVYYEVDHAPAANVIEVVRCKDCESWDTGYGYCKKCGLTGYGHSPFSENGYCSRGVRKGGSNDEVR
jgi:hypothetical protein